VKLTLGREGLITNVLDRDGLAAKVLDLVDRHQRMAQRGNYLPTVARKCSPRASTSKVVASRLLGSLSRSATRITNQFPYAGIKQIMNERTPRKSQCCSVLNVSRETWHDRIQARAIHRAGQMAIRAMSVARSPPVRSPWRRRLAATSFATSSPIGLIQVRAGELVGRDGRTSQHWAADGVPPRLGCSEKSPRQGARAGVTR
jgi:hypothetical protein